MTPLERAIDRLDRAVAAAEGRAEADDRLREEAAATVRAAMAELQAALGPPAAVEAADAGARPAARRGPVDG
jgi:hypothetical protein